MRLYKPKNPNNSTLISAKGQRSGGKKKRPSMIVEGRCGALESKKINP